MAESLVVVAGMAAGSEIPLGPELRLGRLAEAPGTLGGDPELSRDHALISRRADGTYRIEDLGSSNGTYLNGWRMPTPQVLSHGDRIQVGQTVLEARLDADASATSVERRPAVLAGGAEASVGPSGQTPVLRAAGIRKSYGSHEVLKGLDLEIQPGEVCGLLGPNGAGKTTFVSIVAGLLSANAGSVHLSGIDALARPREAKRYLGLAPQELGIYPTMTVRRNLELFGEIAGLRGARLRQRVDEVGAALSLTEKFDAKASTCSGGQQRRLHTAMALLHRPPLLILDEPTVGADIRTRQEILEAVKRLAAEGHGICYSTHYLPEIEELGASVAILDGGRIIARGSIAELVTKYSLQAVELQFDGPAPDIRLSGDVMREGSLIRIVSQDPAAAAAEALARLGIHALRLQRVEMIRPSLDAVYLALTQRRYSIVQELPADFQGRDR